MLQAGKARARNPVEKINRLYASADICGACFVIGGQYGGRAGIGCALHRLEERRKIIERRVEPLRPDRGHHMGCLGKDGRARRRQCPRLLRCDGPMPDRRDNPKGPKHVAGALTGDVRQFFAGQ